MVLDWGLNPVPAALEASTLPLGYQGGGCLGLDLITTYLLDFNPNIYTINFKCFAVLFFQLKLMFDLTIDSALNIPESLNYVNMCMNHFGRPSVNT